MSLPQALQIRVGVTKNAIFQGNLFGRLKIEFDICCAAPTRKPEETGKTICRSVLCTWRVSRVSV